METAITDLFLGKPVILFDSYSRSAQPNLQST